MKGDHVAIFTGTLFSEYLDKKVKFRAIVPTPGPSKEADVETKAPLKTLYLLHGWNGNYEDWTYYSDILMLAEQNSLAVIMPDGENSFYSDHITGAQYGKFYQKELVEKTRFLFPLSDKREDTFVAGLSMGGYGALRVGLTCPETFGKIGALSSPIFYEGLYSQVETEEIGGLIVDTLLSLFKKNPDGDFHPDNDIYKLVERADPMPDLYLACGQSDELLKLNEDFHQWLTARGIAHHYVTGPGEHLWPYWNEQLPLLLDWLLDKD